MDKRDNLIMIGFIVGLIFVAVALIINTTKSCDVNIDYDVTADSNMSNAAPNIAEVKLACYKLCVDELRGSDTQQNKCFDKCGEL